jgi:hypothetical protein
MENKQEQTKEEQQPNEEQRPNEEQIKFYKVNVFDDGNQRAKYVINKWIVCSSDNLGKVFLLNINGKDRISSISSWKISQIE